MVPPLWQGGGPFPSPVATVEDKGGSLERLCVVIVLARCLPLAP